MRFILTLVLLLPGIVLSGERELECLAQNAYHEARGEGKIGMKAVIDVTLNRKEAKGFPDTICGVVWQKFQFSWTRNHVTISDEVAWQNALTLAKKAMAGKNRGITKNALYFHEASITPKWSNSFKKTMVINNHVFYAERM